MPLMDAAGVDRAVLIPPSWADDGNAAALNAVAAYPDRFAAMGLLSWEDPEAVEMLRSLHVHPGLVGVRQTFHSERFTRWLDDGTAERIWSEAEESGTAIMVYPPGVVLRFADVAARHPGLRLVIDHLGLPLEMPSHDFTPYIKELTQLARLPNVAVKASALPLYTNEEPPFRDLQETVYRVIEAFGPERTFWGSDLTRLRCTYEDVVAMGTELTFLSTDERELVMGKALSDWLGWPC